MLKKHFFFVTIDDDKAAGLSVLGRLKQKVGLIAGFLTNSRSRKGDSSSSEFCIAKEFFK
jgi:hypothetical protein